MKLLRAMFVIAFSLSVVATASARHADGDTQPCPTCEKIYDYLYRISVEPNTAAQMDLSNFVSQLDRTHLLDFATGIYNRENEMYNLTKRNVQLGAFSA